MASKKIPSAYTILLALMFIAASLTWVLPVGHYNMVKSERLGRMVPVAGTFHASSGHPQSLLDVVLAPIDGAYDHISNAAHAMDIGLFVLIIGGFLGVVTSTGAIHAGIERISSRLEGREKWLIPILMGVFAAGGTIYGMAEETLPFYILLIPIVMRAGFDPVVAVSIILLGSGIGVTGSTINPFSTVIASDAAGIPFTNGMLVRFVILGLDWLVCVAYVMYYAECVRRDYGRSFVADQMDADRQHFLCGRLSRWRHMDMTGRHKLTLLLFGFTFCVMIYGVSALGWRVGEMSALFLVMSIMIGVMARMSETQLVSEFINGSRDLVGVMMVIILARGLVVIMDNGGLTATILHYGEQMGSGHSPMVFIGVVYWFEGVMAMLIPSSSGLAVLSMPILAPLADFSGVSRHLVVTAFQTASGLSHMITPTSGVLMGALAIGNVPYSRWVCFLGPILMLLALLNMAILSLSAVM